MMKIFLLHLLALCISYNAFAAKPDFIVAKDGSGNFTTVQEAINAVGELNSKRTVILIKNGTYKKASKRRKNLGCKEL